MFGNSHLDRMRETFSDQFSSDGHDFIYRRSQRGPALRVSKLERDELLAAFNRRIRIAMWSTMSSTLIFILLLVWLVPDTGGSGAQNATWVGVAAIVSLFTGLFYRAWSAPSRELERRNPESPPLSKKEARELTYAKMTYGQLALAALMGASFIFKMSMREDVLHGSGLAWAVFGGGLVLLSVVQAVRKWRFNHH